MYNEKDLVCMKASWTAPQEGETGQGVPGNIWRTCFASLR